MSHVSNLGTALAAIAPSGASPAATSAFAAIVIGTDSIENHMDPNPAMARELAALGSRLITHAQRTGLPALQSGVIEQVPRIGG